MSSDESDTVAQFSEQDNGSDAESEFVGVGNDDGGSDGDAETGDDQDVVKSGNGANPSSSNSETCSTSNPPASPSPSQSNNGASPQCDPVSSSESPPSAYDQSSQHSNTETETPESPLKAGDPSIPENKDPTANSCRSDDPTPSCEVDGDSSPLPSQNSPVLDSPAGRDPSEQGSSPSNTSHDSRDTDSEVQTLNDEATDLLHAEARKLMDIIIESAGDRETKGHLELPDRGGGGPDTSSHSHQHSVNNSHTPTRPPSRSHLVPSPATSPASSRSSLISPQRHPSTSASHRSANVFIPS
ncbi:hypothetical protein SISSUDRAFT_128658 [Sistotremastrum suecicum HHB10207 ss-3]|uniref:Uncharacterized protein n=1 Tax=Sistotremastrum suecicum HHB10207 ss-3 TaxID=1314776 RepID=A0A166AYN1_9AGAM|nr:hypothetical protein SISSUDRAFT_128658 [Sistotremastrum suecicum HHB10207 ss-3]